MLAFCLLVIIVLAACPAALAFTTPVLVPFQHQRRQQYGERIMPSTTSPSRRVISHFSEASSSQEKAIDDSTLQNQNEDFSDSMDQAQYDDDSQPVSNIPTANTFGSFLLKRQRQEEENLRRLGLNETAHLKLLVDNPPIIKSENNNQGNKQKPVSASISMDYMDREAIRELDEAVVTLIEDSITEGIEPLALSSLYSALTNQTRTIADEETFERAAKISRLFRTEQAIDDTQSRDAVFKNDNQNDMPLSKPEHYNDRIGRDMRHLAVSIAANINTPWQWKMFCEESNGGVLPLLRCIKDGAHFVQERGIEIEMHDHEQEEFWNQAVASAQQEYDESIMVACTASRSLRDLCALSPELSAVITDDILRADASVDNNANRIDGNSNADSCIGRKGVVMEDFCTLLKDANDVEHIYKRMYNGGRARRRRRQGVRNGVGLDNRKNRKEARKRCKLYVLQLLLAMAVTSDNAVQSLRATPGLTEAVLACSSYAQKEKTRRWLRYPVEVVKKVFRRSKSRPFITAASVGDDLGGNIQGTANQVLAAIGHNQWIPKVPGQKGLRILSLDGGGSRGIVAISTLIGLVESMNGVEVSDSFDIIAGTSTGAIIAFLTGLRKETAKKTKSRYSDLIKRIFIKSALAKPMLLFTTATYDEGHFTNIMKEVLGDWSMLDSRADPTVPLVFAVTSKMSSTPTHVSLFRNYNYASGEFPDPFVIDPDSARRELGLALPTSTLPKAKMNQKPAMPGVKSGVGSRHPGSFRVLQRIGLRASTAAPTVFKPISMGGEIYCDGAMVASNPTAVAIHEARTLFPDVPIELVVSCGTGGFVEVAENPKFGWDGIIGQIVNSATDSEQIHHVLEDVLGEEGTVQRGRSRTSQARYYRLNPVLGEPDDFPIDVTDPKLLDHMSKITERYLQEPEQQRKLQEIGDILDGRRWWERALSRRKNSLETSTKL